MCSWAECSVGGPSGAKPFSSKIKPTTAASRGSSTSSHRSERLDLVSDFLEPYLSFSAPAAARGRRAAEPGCCMFGGGKLQAADTSLGAPARSRESWPGCNPRQAEKMQQRECQVMIVFGKCVLVDRQNCCGVRLSRQPAWYREDLRSDAADCPALYGATSAAH